MPVLLVNLAGPTRDAPCNVPHCKQELMKFREKPWQTCLDDLIISYIWVMRICGTMWQCQEWCARMTVSIADSWRCSVSCCMQNNLPGRSYWHICLYLRQPHLCNRLRNTPWADLVSATALRVNTWTTSPPAVLVRCSACCMLSR